MSVGVDVLDSDHKQLISIIAQLSDLIEQGKTSEAIEKIFNQLEEYVTVHFTREEEMMKRANFESYVQHVAQHRNFSEKVPMLKQKLLDADSIEVSLEVNLFLYQWLINHILSEDMSYVQSLLDSGQADEVPDRDSFLHLVYQFVSQQLTLGKRILLTALLPVFAIIGLSWVVFSTNYQSYQTTRELLSLSHLVQRISSVIHTLQSERGLTVGFSGSEYTQFRNSLTAQRRETDRMMSALQNTLSGLSAEMDEGKAGLGLIYYNKWSLDMQQLRKEIDARGMNIELIFSAYTRHIYSLLNISEKMALMEVEGSISRTVSALVALLNLKESVGQERAWGTFGIERGGLSVEELQQLTNLMGQQKAYQRVYTLSASVQQNQQMQAFLLGAAQLQVQQDETAFFAAIQSNLLGDMDSSAWFEHFSEKMDRLEQLVNILVVDIQQSTQNEAEQLQKQLYIATAILLLVILLVLLFSWVLNRSIILPVQKVTHAMSVLAGGRRDICLTDHFGDDEVGAMVDAYEQCRRALLQSDVAARVRFRKKDIDLSNRPREKDLYQELASVDPLTGSLNRRKFEEYAISELSRVRRYSSRLSLMMLDIDHFKIVNDTYGHATGDVVLKQFYECCKNCVRETDIVARIGGEEFVILLPETGESDAIELAQRVRLAVKQLLIPVEQGEIRITVSIGVTEWNKDAFRGIEEMMQYADKALYEAKEGGRNQVVSFSHFQ